MWKLIKFFIIPVLSFVVLLYIIFPVIYSKTTSFHRSKVEKKCSLNETLSNTGFQFWGFDNNEFDSVLVKEYNGTKLMDSFNIFVKPTIDINAITRIRFVDIYRPLNINHKYLFIVPGQKPYELSNIKMKALEGEGISNKIYLCELDSYTLNGENIRENDIRIIKRNNNVAR